MKNKRGDLPVVLLVIFVLVIGTVALVSFLVSNTREANSFVNFGVFENLTSQANDFYFYLNTGVSPADAAKLVGGKFNSNTNQLTLQGEDPGKISVTYIINVKGNK